jgi:hypothetical protein
MTEQPDASRFGEVAARKARQVQSQDPHPPIAQRVEAALADADAA